MNITAVQASRENQCNGVVLLTAVVSLACGYAVKDQVKRRTKIETTMQLRSCCDVEYLDDQRLELVDLHVQKHGCVFFVNVSYVC